VVVGDVAGKYKSKKNTKFFIFTIASLYQIVNLEFILHRKFLQKKNFTLCLLYIGNLFHNKFYIKL